MICVPFCSLSMCVCVCVLTGFRDDQCDRIMRWFFRASVSDCSILRLCRLLLCTLPCPSCYSNLHHSYHTSSSASWASSPSATQGHSLTLASLVSVPACGLPNPPSFLRFLLCDILPTAPPPSLMPLGATKPPSCSIPLRTLFSLRTPQIKEVVPPTEPRLPAVSLCKSSLCVPAASRTPSAPGVCHVPSLSCLTRFPMI